MGLKTNQLALALANRVPLGNALVLLHGTTDNAFANKLQAKAGMNDDQSFRNNYCQPKMGKFLISGRNYGPGLYLTDSMNECLEYAKTGGIILRFTFDTSTLYIDFSTHELQLAFCKLIGKAVLWQFLEDPLVAALIKVTPAYYVLRTCGNFTVARLAGDDI